MIFIGAANIGSIIDPDNMDQRTNYIQNSRKTIGQQSQVTIKQITIAIILSNKK